jgi:hypothetical protein
VAGEVRGERASGDGVQDEQRYDEDDGNGLLFLATALAE